MNSPESLRAAVVAPKPVPVLRARDYVKKGYWAERRLRDGIEAAASERPDDTALIDAAAALTWGELASRVASGARTLVDIGVGPRTAVILISGNTAEGVVAYHSLLRVGATAVLLDRRCGKADLRVARDAVSASVVLLPDTERLRLDDELGDTQKVRLGDLAVDDRPGRSGTKWVEPDRDQPAVVLFTSGTTSRPKGVIHSLNTLTSAWPSPPALARPRSSTW